MHESGGPGPGDQADQPILHWTEDHFDCGRLARAFARHTLDMDARRGLVVGVFGAWGSGKTSFNIVLRGNLYRTAPRLADGRGAGFGAVPVRNPAAALLAAGTAGTTLHWQGTV